jgi:hypothetical protein
MARGVRKGRDPVSFSAKEKSRSLHSGRDDSSGWEPCDYDAGTTATEWEAVVRDRAAILNVEGLPINPDHQSGSGDAADHALRRARGLVTLSRYRSAKVNLESNSKCHYPHMTVV